MEARNSGGDMNTGLTMGQLAALSGVPRSTIRFYERRGLLPAVPRTESGYRLFDENAAVRVRFAQRAQTLGFTLSEIEAFLHLSDTEQLGDDTITHFATKKLLEIDTRIRDLERVRTAITQRLARGFDANTPCPILESLGACPPEL
jgi:DNA-binding transcriptional MerR regulator